MKTISGFNRTTNHTLKKQVHPMLEEIELCVSNKREYEQRLIDLYQSIYDKENLSDAQKNLKAINKVRSI